MSVTMKDIALLAGVSRQAVSAVLNGNGTSRVSEENSQKILRIAKEINYVPNVAARSLKGSPTRTIGLLGSPFGSGLNSALFSEIARILHTKEYNLLTCDYGLDPFTSSASGNLTELLARGVDGIIIVNSKDRKKLEKNQQVPYVFCSHNNTSGYDVGIDNFEGGYKAVKHFLEHGRTRIYYLCIGLDPGDLKYSGMQKALAEANLKTESEQYIDLRQLKGMSAALIKELLGLQADAVFCSNDYVAAKLIAVLKHNRINVPDDIAVIGYDGYTFSEFAPVPLTTVIQQVREQAEIATDILL